jgi:hypothetical protein
LVIRVTKSQLRLFERNLARAGSPAGVPEEPHPRRPRAWMPENMLEGQIRDFLAWRGFINVRQHVGTFLPLRVVKQLQHGQISFEQALRNVVRIGEEGAADWWSARPLILPGSRALDGPHLTQSFFWEAKSPSKRPSAAQLVWLERRRQVGLEATWFNQFAAADRPSAAVEPRESPVFEIWFFGYFEIGERLK